MLSYYNVGIIGTVLYSCLFGLALFQFIKQVFPYYPPFFTTRKVFHLLVCLYAGLQAGSFSSFLKTESYSKGTYSLHLIAILTEMVAFSLVSVLWSKTLLSRSYALKFVVPFVLCLDALFAIYVSALVVDISITSQDFSSWTETSFIFREMLLVEPVILGINGILIMLLGLKIQNRLRRDHSWHFLDSSQRRIILLRFSFIIITVFVCFALRASLELWVFVNGSNGIDRDVWWTFSNWVPTILPCVILLYAMRRHDTAMADDESQDIDADFEAKEKYFYTAVETRNAFLSNEHLLENSERERGAH